MTFKPGDRVVVKNEARAGLRGTIGEINELRQVARVEYSYDGEKMGSIYVSFDNLELVESVNQARLF